MKNLVVFFLSFAIVFLPIPISGMYIQGVVFNLNIFNYSYSLYKYGISSDAGNVVLGDDGWLFLGDSINSVQSKSRVTYIKPIKDIESNNVFMNQLQEISKEVNANFKFVVFPNKHSIYGEKIGLNSQPDSYSYYDDIDFSMTDYFRLIKNKITDDLYFKTDSHWNNLGAFYGYQYIMSHTLSNKYEKISEALKFKRVNFKTGDLARFLNIKNLIAEQNMIVKKAVRDKVKRINLATNEVSNENIQGRINNSEIKVPIKIQNKQALNALNVLWLHDSFGRSMSPYIHYTFNNVTHQHYDYAFNNEFAFKKLVKDIKPDLIILSMVERNYLSLGKHLGWTNAY